MARSLSQDRKRDVQGLRKEGWGCCAKCARVWVEDVVFRVVIGLGMLRA